MKNLLFSLILAPIALIFGSQFTAPSSSAGDPVYDSTAVNTLHLIDPLDCCGGDLEDPIIRGTVKNGLSQTISGATVDVYQTGNPTSLGSTTTDSQGLFEVQVVPGNYFFDITPPGCGTTTTGGYQADDDITIEIII